MKSYRVHLIRHGAIEDTYKGLYVGTTDVGLSNEGERELRILESEMRYPYAKAVFTSPLKRCTQTAGILYPDLEPIVLDQLSEMNFGEWECKSAEELKDDPDFVKWLSGDNSVKPERGESTDNFTRRVCNIFIDIVNGLMKTGYEDAVIITHGGVMNLLLAVFGLPKANPFDWQCDNGYGYSLRITPSLWQRDMVCEVYSKQPLGEEYYE